MPDHGFRVTRLGSVASTQDELAARARAGEDVTGVCLRAAEQTKGRGRRGSPWASPPGGSYQSAGLGRETWPWLTLALGVGIAEALASGFGADVKVKWPNDLYLGRGKLGGIITEVVSGQVVAGVGVNVRNPPPPGGAAIDADDPETASDVVLSGLERGLALARLGGDAVRARFAAVDLLRGLEVSVVEGHGAALTGVAAGVDASGALLLAVDGGATVRVETGHVARFGEPSP